MSLRTWLLRQIARLPDSEPDDPSRLVEFATVQLFEGPLIAEVLGRSDITVQQVPGYNGATGLETVTLNVAMADLDEANTVLAEFRGR